MAPSDDYTLEAQVVLPPMTPPPILLRPSPVQAAASAELVPQAPESEASFGLFHKSDTPIPGAEFAPSRQASSVRAQSQLPAQLRPSVDSLCVAAGSMAVATFQLDAASAKAKASPRLRLSYVEASLLTYSVFYAAVSRVPFTLFAIYMIDDLGFSYVIAALTLGLYCFGRLVGAHTAGMYLGSASMVFGTASGAIAWASILAFSQHWVFVISSFGLGFTETVTGLDSMLKIESLILRRKPEQTQIIFRLQLICTCLGVFLAYMGGGFLYQRRGLGAVGAVCVVFSCVNLLILATMFPRRRIYRQLLIRVGDIMAEVEASTPNGRKSKKGRQSRMSVAGKDVGMKSRVSTYNIDAVEILDVDENAQVSRISVRNSQQLRGSQRDNSTPPCMKTSFFLWTVVACFFFTTLGISTQFAISALYWKRVWGVNPDVVGTIMAVGECLGVCLLVFFGQPMVFNSLLTRYFGKPANVLNACVGMGALCWLITANNRIACLVGSVGVHMCNVCVHSFQAELIGVCAPGEQFAKWISMSYVVKRAANCVCVFGSIVFFDAFGPQTSYRVIGSGLVFYASVLCAIYGCMRTLPCQRRAK